MRVFIGWSGTRSQALAQALHEWMPLVLHYVEPWVSEADVAAGERWAQVLSKELETSNFGIVCVTRENVGSPWILFEAGSLAKSLEEGRVIPLLLDLEFSEISGPLAQFQAKKVDKDGVSEVVQSINKVEAQPVPEPQAKKLFDALWPQLESVLESIPEDPDNTKPIRPQHEILEELVSAVRALDARLRTIEEASSAEPSRLLRSRRLGRMHPFMLEELPHVMGAESPADPIMLLFCASMVREEMPFLYELGLDAYRLSKAGPSAEAQVAVERFERALDVMSHGPFAEELGLDPRALHTLARHVEHYLAIASERVGQQQPRPNPRRRRAPTGE